ncbi:MAG: hypothetical protein QXT66_07185, partial [Nitrososphaerota archaeon]
DDFVLKTFAGKTFMDVFNAFYYSWSPAVAEAEYSNPALRETVKYMIYPLIGSLQLSRIAAEPLAAVSSELSVISAGVVVSNLLGIIYLAPISLLVRRFLLSRKRLPVTAPRLAWLMMVLLPILATAVYFQNGAVVAFASSALVLGGLCLGCALPYTIAKALASMRSR